MLQVDISALNKSVQVLPTIQAEVQTCTSLVVQYQVTTDSHTSVITELQNTVQTLQNENEKLKVRVESLEQSHTHLGNTFRSQGKLGPSKSDRERCISIEGVPENTSDDVRMIVKQIVFDTGVKGTPSIPETYLSSSVAWGLNLRVG